jgi:hypothetical protein
MVRLVAGEADPVRPGVEFAFHLCSVIAGMCP